VLDRLAITAVLASGCGRIDFDELTIGFIGPQGSDANPGTREWPWLTWSHAVARLGPGSTLTALDGTYSVTRTGPLDIDCRDASTACDGEPCASGTAGQPIELRADHERGAVITGPAIRLFHMSGCTDWTVTGLRVDGVDVDLGPQPVTGLVAISDSERIAIKRWLIRTSNRQYAQQLVAIRDTKDLLLEENELYEFHDTAIQASQVLRAVLRRNYAHSRGHAPLTPTCGLQLADNGFVLNNAMDSIVENNVVELACNGMANTTSPDTVNPLPEWGDNNRFLGNLVLAGIGGYFIQSRCQSAVPCTEQVRLVENTLLRDNVAIGYDRGFWVRGAINTRIESGSSFIANRNGVLIDLSADNTGIAATTYVINTQVESAIWGFDILGQTDWLVDHANASAPTPYTSLTNVVASTTVNPMFGACRVRVPASSPLKGAGIGGADIGANIVNRYEDGVLTATPLWSPGFPCGAQVAGINDDPTASASPTQACGNLHLRIGMDGNCP